MNQISEVDTFSKVSKVSKVNKFSKVSKSLRPPGPKRWSAPRASFRGRRSCLSAIFYPAVRVPIQGGGVRMQGRR